MGFQKINKLLQSDKRNKSYSNRGRLAIAPPTLLKEGGYFRGTLISPPSFKIALVLQHNNDAIIIMS